MIDASILDSEVKIKGIDRSNMLGKVFEFPRMLKEAVALAKSIKLDGIGSIDGVVISGMGGSAICGDIVRGVVEEKIEIPIIVNRGYSLPRFVSGNTLFFAVSYSGNTEETLSSLREAEARALKIIMLSSGGKLSEIAKQKGYPLVSLPSGIQPRAALPYLLSSILVILERLGVSPGASLEIEESLKLLGKLREEYMKEHRSNSVKQLAQRLYGKVPIVFASEGITSAAGLRWVTQFNENSKMMAHLSIFPEMGHNEIVGLADLKRGKHDFSVMILRDQGDHERIKKKIEITKSLIEGELGGVTEVFSRGEGKLARILSLILYGDFLSVYVAILRNIDPTPVKVIEKLKKELSR